MENRTSNRIGKWLFRAIKRLVSYLTSVVIGLIIMLIVLDGLAIYSGRETARDFARQLAVAGGQVLQQGGDRAQAEQHVRQESERQLVEVTGIEFPEKRVVVSIVYKPRSMLLRYIPWVKGFTSINEAGSYSYQ